MIDLLSYCVLIMLVFIAYICHAVFACMHEIYDVHTVTKSPKGAFLRMCPCH